jgi:soluble P-type ATPase
LKIHVASADRKGKLMEGEDTNVHSLNFPKDADVAASDKLVRQAPAIAKMRKALFDAYVAEGFTVDQAIKLLCM